MASGVGVVDGGLVSEDAGADLGEGFAEDGVYFSGHDGGAGLGGGEGDFPDAAAGSGGEEADVVGNFEERGREGIQGGVGVGEVVLGGLCFEVIDGFAEGKLC